MVNIRVPAMDDYELNELTDIGTTTVGFNSKDDSKRRIVNRWDQEEVITMLSLIKENDFVTQYSVQKMSGPLSNLMLKKGYSRTDKQIYQKLTMMRKNFLACEKQRRVTGILKECPFYKELRDVYRDANHHSNDFDSEEDESSGQDECMIKFPNDPSDWSEAEVQKMLNSIKSMRLKNELTLTFFSPVAIRMIAEAMQNSGYNRNNEQVKNALINLRTMYINYKIAFDNNENPSECMFFPSLDIFWGKEYKKCRLKEKKKPKTDDDDWSTEETIVLLTLIQDLNVSEEAYNNSEKAAENLKHSLAENGYCRSKQQIMDRLEEMKADFVNVHNSYSKNDAVKQFPFYNLYKKLFERQFAYDVLNQSTDLSSDNQKDSLDHAGNKLVKKNGTIWLKDEVKLLLRTIQELTSRTKSNESLEDEKLKRLVEVLNRFGYHKTAEQIKRKLALLKESYLKCNLDDSSEKDIFECPFYNELHHIFHTPVSDERYDLIQSLLNENVDPNASRGSDHSYTNVKLANSSGECGSNGKVTVIPNKSLDSWFPVESIIDEDGIAASSSIGMNDLSTISTNETEQIVEDTFLATLPKNDCQFNGNCTKPNSMQNDVDTEHLKSLIDSIAYSPASKDKSDLDPNKIYRYEDSLAKQAVLFGEDDGPPPNKKPRIIEDEKLGKNKVLLRPIESQSIQSMNPSSLNMSNTKFVRLIVANEPNKSRVNHITAHIEPMKIETANSVHSVSSGMSSPVDRIDFLKIATEKNLNKDDFDTHKLHNGKSGCTRDRQSLSNNSDSNISDAIKEAVQSMVKNDELMQQRHHAWMEEQFELQRKHEQDQSQILINELKELRSTITGLFANLSQANNQNR